MSTKKNNKSKQKRLKEKQRLEKKKMLLRMKKEIKKLEMEIKHSKISNSNIKALKALKISLRFGQLIAPYAVTAGIVIGGFSILGATPFYIDDHKKKLEMKKEFDSSGNIRYEQQYDAYENSKSTISYYGKWMSQTDGFYSRDVEIYSIGDITEEKIMKLVNQNNISSLQEVLGKPISKKIETKNNLTEKELTEGSYLQAIMYNEFEDDFIMVKESSGDNIGLTVVCLFITLLAEIIPLAWRSFSHFDFGDCVKEIKRKHPAIDIEKLVKKLEIKRSNYDRLTR